MLALLMEHLTVPSTVGSLVGSFVGEFDGVALGN